VEDEMARAKSKAQLQVEMSRARRGAVAFTLELDREHLSMVAQAQEEATGKTGIRPSRQEVIRLALRRLAGKG
jgi:hypothetical protein